MPRPPPPRMPRAPSPRMLPLAKPSDVEDYVRRASNPLSTNAESYLLQPQPTMTPPHRMPRAPPPRMPPASPPWMLAPAKPSDEEDYVRRASNPLSTNAESYLLQPQPMMPRAPTPRMLAPAKPSDEEDDVRRASNPLCTNAESYLLQPQTMMPRAPPPRMLAPLKLSDVENYVLRASNPLSTNAELYLLQPQPTMPRAPPPRMPRAPPPRMHRAPPPWMLAPPKPSFVEGYVRRAINRQLAQVLERIDLMFNTYANKSSGLIDPEGIERLCANVFQVDHTDVRLLMLAWKMKAKKQGFFTIEEWRRGLIALQSGGFNEIEKEIADPKVFADFYSYAFQNCLTENMQKSVDVEGTCQLLKIVLGPKYPDQVKSFVEYLQVQKDYKVINMDQWMGFLHFCNEVHFPSMDNYDPSLAWPIILDNFVDWLGEKQR